MSVDTVVRHLRAQGLFLMVIIDAMEALYQDSSVEIRSVIDEIAWLANTTSGRTSLMGCTSSSLHPLVKGEGWLPQSLETKCFPMCAVRSPLPHLKRDTVCRVIIAPNALIDTSTVSGFIEHPFSAADLSATLFAYGSDVAALTEASDAPSPPLLPLRTLAASLSTRAMPTYTDAFLAAFPETIAACTAIYDMLYQRNKALLDAFMLAPSAVASGASAGAGRSHTLDAAADTTAVTAPAATVLTAYSAADVHNVLRRISARVVGGTDWRRRFKPLTEADIPEVFASILPARDIMKEEAILDFLHFDAALVVTVHELPGSEHFDLYPSSLLALIAHQHGSSSAGGA